MTALLQRKADTLRIFDDLLADEEFWREFSQELERQISPRLLVVFFAGAEAAARLPLRRAEKAEPLSVSDFIDPDTLAKLGEQAIRDYVSPFSKQITQTTYDGVRDAVIRARRDGTGVEGVIDSIAPLFGPKRAEMIAVTETTRLFGLGSQAVYQAQGYPAWEWRTAEDPWVCATCGPLAGQTFPISQSFSPSHPRCRCWPTPAFELSHMEARALTEDELKEIATTIPEAAITGYPGDRQMEAMAKIRGFDAAPTIGDVDAVVRAGGTELRRGVTQVEFAEAFKHGDYFAGQGIYGNGTYAAGLSNLSAAEAHTSGGSGATIRIALPADAKVITWEKIDKLQYEFSDTFDDMDVRRMLGTDPGKVAMQLGYDAIYVERRDFWVILNRSILTVEE